MKTKNIKTILEDSISKQIKSLEELKNNMEITFLATLEIKDVGTCNKGALSHLENGITTIYIIKSDEKIDYTTVSKERKNLTEKKFQMAEINDTNWKDDKNKENCVYVGRSGKIKERLGQHLFLERETTYALRLKKLFKRGKIFIDLYQCENESNEVQIFEDLLWDYYKPLFGKQGKK